METIAKYLLLDEYNFQRKRLEFRIILCLLFFVPSLPLLYLAFSALGIGLVIPFMGVLYLPFAYASGSDEQMNECKEMLIFIPALLLQPLILWAVFVYSGEIRD